MSTPTNSSLGSTNHEVPNAPSHPNRPGTSAMSPSGEVPGLVALAHRRGHEHAEAISTMGFESDVLDVAVQDFVHIAPGACARIPCSW